MTFPHGRNGLNARQMAVLSPFRAPALGRHVHRELLRSALPDVTPIISVTPRSRGLTVPAIFFAWGNCIPRGIEAQCVTDEQVMGLDPIALLALLLA